MIVVVSLALASACSDGVYVLGTLPSSDGDAWSEHHGEDPDGDDTGDTGTDDPQDPVSWSSTLVFGDTHLLSTATGPLTGFTRTMPQFLDLDDDGDQDLVLGLDVGTVLAYVNNLAQGPGVDLGSGTLLLDRAGDPIGGPALAGLQAIDADDDGRTDLVVRIDSGVRLYLRAPEQDGGGFAPPVDVPVPWSADGQRFAVADWDGDERWDILTGGDDALPRLHRNLGSSVSPVFATPTVVDALEGSYGDTVTTIDFNRDGIFDVLLARPDGTFDVRMGGTSTAPSFGSSISLRFLRGEDVSHTVFAGPHAVTQFVDVDGDGIGDVVMGGDHGDVVVAQGVPLSEHLATLRGIVDDHGVDLGAALADAEPLRRQLFALHRTVREGLDGRYYSADECDAIFAAYVDLVQSHAALFRRESWDVEVEPYVPLLAAQHGVILHAAEPDSPAHREVVIDTLGLVGPKAALFREFAVLLADNGRASQQQHDAIFRYLAAVPRHLWDVALLYVGDWVGPIDSIAYVSSRGNVWLNSIEVGTQENSFPADSTPGYTDVFTITLAHLLNHFSLDSVGRRTRPELYRRKFTLLAQASGHDIAYHPDLRRGVDWAATQARFVDRGLWDGVEPWNDAWRRYFQSGEGQNLYYYALRSNLSILLEQPRYAFATLANQYFTDSQIMLDLAKARWDRGYRTNINQFLHVVEYYSDGANEVRFYRMGVDAMIEYHSVALERDGTGRVNAIVTDTGTYRFGLDAHGDVLHLAFEPV